MATETTTPTEAPPADLDRRLAWLPLSPDDLYHLVASRGEQWPMSMLVRRFAGLPRGVLVVSMRMEEEPARLSILLRHPTFAAVPEGGQVPRLSWGWHTHVVELLNLDGSFEEGARARLVDALEAENEQLRRLFDDLRLDCPPVDQAFRRGLEAAARLIESKRQPGESQAVLTVAKLAAEVRGLEAFREAA